MSVRSFERRAERRIESLRKALIAGRYRPGPLRRAWVPKDDGGARPLDIPCVADRIVQTAVAKLLTPVIDPHLEPESYAYRPGKSVAQAISAVGRARRDGYRWTAEGDIRRCFEEIPHEPLLEELDRLCQDENLVDLVGLWLESHAPGGVGIPQGSPISPLLCNLHLDAVDEVIAGQGVRLVRYADDFVLLTKTAADAEAALERMAGLLRERGLALNTDKTRIRAYDQSLRFLGHLFVRGMAWKEVWGEEDVSPLVPTEEALSPDCDDKAGEQERGGPQSRRNRRSVIYLVEAGARLSVRNHSFVISMRGDEPGPSDRNVAMRHAGSVERIEIGPGAVADWSAMELAALYGVPVASAGSYGETSGWWSGPRDLRATRIAEQARFLADPERAADLANRFALGRVRSQRAYLSRANRPSKSHLQDTEIAAACVALGRIIRKFSSPFAIAEARGHEGEAGALYWPAYARLFEPVFGFDGRRRRRPPPDAVNACLSYSSALLEREIRAAVGRAGLHPGLGALHAPREDGDALVYDLMEAFRAPVTEAMVATLVARKAIKPDMFAIVEFVGEDGSRESVCRMERSARKALIRGHEAWLARPIGSRRTGKQVTWRALFEEEARALAAHFAGQADFVPYEPRY